MSDKENDRVIRRCAGAEYKTLGELLLRGICAFMAYKNQKSWDIICLSDDKQKDCKISVKSSNSKENINQKNGLMVNTIFLFCMMLIEILIEKIIIIRFMSYRKRILKKLHQMVATLLHRNLKIFLETK